MRVVTVVALTVTVTLVFALIVVSLTSEADSNKTDLEHLNDELTSNSPSVTSQPVHTEKPPQQTGTGDVATPAPTTTTTTTSTSSSMSSSSSSSAPQKTSAESTAAAPPTVDHGEGSLAFDEGFDEALRLAQEFRERFRKRYRVPERTNFTALTTLFENMVDFSNSTTIVHRMMRKIKERSTFKWTFAGTSLTAGHDNLFTQAYPYVFGQIMKPVFAAVGVEAITVNAAMGANPIYPYTWCLQTHLGDDSDVITWEMEFMTGNWESGRTVMNQEQWIRRSFAMSSRPSVIFIGSGVKRMHARWDMKLISTPQLLAHYKGTTASPAQLQLRVAYTIKYPTNDGSEEFLGFNMDKEEFGGDPLWHLKEGKDGHKCCGGASWHPGPNGHQFYADFLALAYLRLFETALENLRKEIAPVDLIDSRLSPPPFYPRKHGLRWFWDNFGTGAGSYGFDPLPSSFVPNIKCLMLFKPNARPERDLMKWIDNAAETTIDFRPNITNAARNGFWPVEEKKWYTTLAFQDIGPVRRARAHGAGYHDYKWAIYGKAGFPPLTIKFKSGQKTGPLAICAPPLPNFPPPNGVQIISNKTVVVKIDGVEQKNMFCCVKGNLGFPPFSCTVVTQELTVGEHVLTIQPLDNNNPKVISAVSHIAFFSDDQ